MFPLGGPAWAVHLTANPIVGQDGSRRSQEERCKAGWAEGWSPRPWETRGGVIGPQSAVIVHRVGGQGRHGVFKFLGTIRCQDAKPVTEVAISKCCMATESHTVEEKEKARCSPSDVLPTRAETPAYVNCGRPERNVSLFRQLSSDTGS